MTTDNPTDTETAYPQVRGPAGSSRRYVSNDNCWRCGQAQVIWGAIYAGRQVGTCPACAATNVRTLDPE